MRVNASVAQPASIPELADFVRETKEIMVLGADTRRTWRGSTAGTPVSTRGLEGITEFTSADQVVVVRAGTLLQDLSAALGEHGQCLPLAEGELVGTVGGALSLNMPLEFEGQCGSWRDWVLGMTVVQADGTIAKAGSRAVKSVAGYDLHKFLVGTRGTLAIVAEVILRTYPRRSLPPTQVTFVPPAESDGAYQRVLATDFLEAVRANPGPGFEFPATHTLYRHGIAMRRYPGDWLLRAGDPLLLTRFVKRAKDLFDPDHCLNPGELA